jgi:ORF6N domain
MCSCVPVKALNQAVKRNADRFPADFALMLTLAEFTSLRSQFVTSKGRGGRRYAPYAFTEHGAIMAANVLNSKQAVQMSVFVVRAFVKLREALASHRELADELTELERKVGTHDKALVSIIAAIRGLTESPKQKPRAIGFRAKREGQSGAAPKQLARRAQKK